MKLSNPKIEKFLIFSQKKLFLYFLGNRTFDEMELSSSKIKKFLIFLEMKLCRLIFFLYFRKEVQACKIKKRLQKNFLYFGKWNFIALRLKNFYISGGNLQSLKIKISHILFLETELFKHKCKRKKFLVLSLIKKQNFLN